MWYEYKFCMLRKLWLLASKSLAPGVRHACVNDDWAVCPTKKLENMRIAVMKDVQFAGHEALDLTPSEVRCDLQSS